MAYGAPGIVEADRFSGQLEELREDYPEIDDIKEAIDWWHERVEIPGVQPIEGWPKHYVAETAPTGRTPSFRYRYHREVRGDVVRVTLLSIEPMVSDEPEG